MRTLGKILATLIVVPLSYLLVVGGWMFALGDISHRQGPGIGAMSLALIATLLIALWWPGIRQRWLAALVGAAAALLGSLLALLAGDLLYTWTYSAAITGGVKALGPILAVVLAAHLMRRPHFTT